MTTAPRTLAQMQHRPTSYEVVARHDDGAETRLAFVGRHTKSVLLHVARQHGSDILAMIGDWDGAAKYSANQGWVFGPVRVCFSGQTERDLATE